MKAKWHFLYNSGSDWVELACERGKYRRWDDRVVTRKSEEVTCRRCAAQLRKADYVRRP